MDVHASVGGPYNVRGFPTIKIFGSNKNSPKDYQGLFSILSILNYYNFNHEIKNNFIYDIV